jgi:hypothetical protein
LDALDALDDVFGVRLEDGAGGVALEDDGAPLDGKVEGVEDTVVGEAEDLGADFLDDAEGVGLLPGISVVELLLAGSNVADLGRWQRWGRIAGGGEGSGGAVHGWVSFSENRCQFHNDALAIPEAKLRFD